MPWYINTILLVKFCAIVVVKSSKPNLMGVKNIDYFSQLYFNCFK